jgi:UDP-N-acetylglucosamine--N-acetylmuramyl-(pentapeptide) pyrophosphoryl-undecaprenol N-acetylglucosamine transferase
VVIAGGGTGGHLFPGLAVAREILRRRPDALVTFAGTRRGLEARVVPAQGFQIDFLRSGGLKGKSLFKLARGVMTLPASGLDAWRIIWRRRPRLVIGLGGYSSGPVVAAAIARKVPTLVLEQNAVPGLTNRLLGRMVSMAAVTYPVTLPYFHGKGFVSGNPVRPEFVVAGPMPEQPGQTMRLLVFGGSQGAHAITVAMTEAAPLLAGSGVAADITHQTGPADAEMVREAYRKAGVRVRVEPFIDQMAGEMKAADLVLCRSGATTLAEVTASARPSILVPLPGSTDDHQRKNAQQMSAAGAAEVIEQSTLTGSLLAGRLVALARDPARRRAMSKAAWGLARPEAAKLIVERALELIGESDAGPPASR